MARAADAMIVPPAAIGVLGGGQLGRYLVAAATVAGYRTVVVDPDPAAPAGRIATTHLVTGYDDAMSLARLAADCAVVTTEFENPPAAALDELGARVRVAPSSHAVAIAQDREAEKRFLADHSIALAPWAVVDGEGDCVTAAALAPAVVLKTARLGYDGKGQATIVDPTPERVAAAWRALGGVRCVAEARLDLDVELSVVVARGVDGATSAFAVTENHHERGILALSVAPARVDAALRARATALATEIAVALDYVGVLAVELFVVGGPAGSSVLVNELAPRPHNSGHWTLDAAVTSQFDQQLRAVTGAPLGDVAMTSGGVAMANLLGDLWWRDGDHADADPVEPDWARALAEPGAHLHLYGKATPRPGRKMGHLTIRAESPDEAAEHARAALEALRQR